MLNPTLLTVRTTGVQGRKRSEGTREIQEGSLEEAAELGLNPEEWIRETIAGTKAGREAGRIKRETGPSQGPAWWSSGAEPPWQPRWGSEP